MSIGRFALRNRALLLLVFLCASIAGIVCATRLASGIYPEMDFPRIAVLVHGGDDPADVFERSTTRPLEQSLLGVVGVERVRSRTLRGSADIQLRFAPGTDMWHALQLVEGHLNDARAGLTAVTTKVERVTPVAFPILSFNVSGNLDPRDLRDGAKLVLRHILARVHGVGAVSVVGGDVREIEIIVDPARAATLHLSYESIANAIRHALPRAAVGRGVSEHAALTIVATAPQATDDDLGAIVIAQDARGAPVPLSAIARVVTGAEDRLSDTGGPRGTAVLVTVSRVEGASTPAVVDGALAAAESARASLPAGTLIEPVYDQGSLVTDSIHGVRDAILLGIVLAILVLGLVLRDVRAGFVAASAVPITLAITFAVMLALGQTLNLMSLGGMAVSIGLVVDDAIVVVEAIARRLERGDSPEEAAVKGTDDLAPAVVGTTATTVVVLLPLLFLDGVVGIFFQTLAKTLAAAVVVSLAVSLLFVPIVAAKVMRKRAVIAVEKRSPVLERMVHAGARRPWIGALVAALAIGFVVFGGRTLPSGLMPSCDEGAFVLDYFAESGTSLEDTSFAAAKIERILRETPEVSTFSRRTGVQINPTAVAPVHKGDFVIRLKGGKRRHVDDVIADVRRRVIAEVPALRTEYVKLLEDMLNDLSGTPRPIEVRVFGPDRAKLEVVAKDVATRLATIDGVVDVYAGVERPSVLLGVDVNRDAAQRVAMSPDDVSFEVRDLLLGSRVGTVQRGDLVLGLRLRAPDDVRFHPEALADLPIATPRSESVTLGAIATVTRRESPTELVRDGLEPVVIVTADHEDRDLGGIHGDVAKMLGSVPRPPGVRFEIGGQLESQRSATRNLLLVGAAALALVFSILVAQFRKLRSATAVLLTAPIAIAFAFAGLFVTGTALDVSSMMGCVLLLGLVVKNGILLVEVSDHEQRAGRTVEEALRIAVNRRARPIVMTTGATIAGMLPLAFAFGAGSELQKPLAIAVLAGLLFSTLASLFVLPSLVRALHRH
ncbi:efflux RND transporter permease subunit [soil metagenome]